MADRRYFSDPRPEYERYLDDIDEQATDLDAVAASIVDQWDFDPEVDDFSDADDDDREHLIEVARDHLARWGDEKSATQALAMAWSEIRHARDEERRQTACQRRPLATRPSRLRRSCARSRGRRTRRSRRDASRSPGGGDSDGDGPGRAWPARDVDLAELCGHEGRARARVAHDLTPTRQPTASDTGSAATRECLLGGLVTNPTRRTTRQGYALVIVDHQGYEGWTTLDANGAVHIERALLRTSDISQPDGFRRRTVADRTFSRSHRWEIRWLREPATDADATEVGR